MPRLAYLICPVMWTSRDYRENNELEKMWQTVGDVIAIQ